MSRFLYYLPEIADPTDALQVAHLATVIPRHRLEHRKCERGPDTASGLMIASTIHTDSATLGYYPDKQTWQRCQEGAFWLGWYTDHPPGPSDLARERQIDGHWVRLADGQRWLVPVARRFPVGTALPQVLYLSETGELIGDVEPAYVGFGQRAETLWEQFMAYHTGELTEDEVSIRDFWDFAVEALSLNYRVGQWEVSALRLLSTNLLHEVCGAIIDVPTLLKVAEAQTRAEKKTAQEQNHAMPVGSSTDSGDTDGSQTTHRPTPTSSGR